MDEMVATDRKCVTVTAHLPDTKVRIGNLDSGRNRSGTSMDAVEAIGVHVIWEPGGATDSGHYHYLVLVYSFLFTNYRECPLQGRQHGEISASRAPPDLLVALEILECVFCHG